MAYDAHKNLSTSVVVTAPSPRDSGTSLVVKAGDGAIFPTPPFNATLTPPNQLPTANNSEIVRVTAISTDTFTITRGQESITAKAIDAGWQIAATITAKTITDIENLLYNPYKFRVYRNAALTLAAASSTKIPFDTRSFDTSSNFDITTNNRFIAPVAGFYQFNSHISVTVATTDNYIFFASKNGSEVSRGNEFINAGTGETGYVWADFLQLAASDFIEMFFFNPSGGGKALTVGTTQSYLSGFLVSQT